jgi:hypothetical protein
MGPVLRHHSDCRQSYWYLDGGALLQQPDAAEMLEVTMQ